jgi:hypothetical protein
MANKEEKEALAGKKLENEGASKSEKTRNILNISRVGRVFNVNGALKGKDANGNTVYETIRIAPEQPAVTVPEDVAAFLLEKLPRKGPRYPELVDADKFSPLSAKAKDALAENAKLLKENEELKAKLAAGSDKPKGEKK